MVRCINSLATSDQIAIDGASAERLVPAGESWHCDLVGSATRRQSDCPLPAAIRALTACAVKNLVLSNASFCPKLGREAKYALFVHEPRKYSEQICNVVPTLVPESDLLSLTHIETIDHELRRRSVALPWVTLDHENRSLKIRVSVIPLRP